MAAGFETSSTYLIQGSELDGRIQFAEDEVEEDDKGMEWMDGLSNSMFMV